MKVELCDLLVSRVMCGSLGLQRTLSPAPLFIIYVIEFTHSYKLVQSVPPYSYCIYYILFQEMGESALLDSADPGKCVPFLRDRC